jgi:hypothetical protein
MLRLITFLWAGCFHKWVEEKRQTVMESDNDKRPIGYASYCRCERCGKPKRFNLY